MTSIANRGLTGALDILISKSAVQKNPYFKTCMNGPGTRFETDAVELSEFGANYTRVFYVKKGESKFTQIVVK